MRNTIIASIMLIASVSTAAQRGDLNVSNNDLLSFGHYPAVADFKGIPDEPLLVTHRERNYRTQIREQARTGPNFAGHFTLAKWGCGSPCLAFVIINAKTGTVYDPGFSVACANENGMDASVDYKLTSRLLITTGFSEKAGCGTDFYEWDGKRLHRIHFGP
jgi:hypothetical protein